MIVEGGRGQGGWGGQGRHIGAGVIGESGREAVGSGKGGGMGGDGGEDGGHGGSRNGVGGWRVGEKSYLSFS